MLIIISILWTFILIGRDDLPIRLVQRNTHQIIDANRKKITICYDLRTHNTSSCSEMNICQYNNATPAFGERGWNELIYYSVSSIYYIFHAIFLIKLFYIDFFIYFFQLNRLWLYRCIGWFSSMNHLITVLLLDLRSVIEMLSNVGSAIKNT